MKDISMNITLINNMVISFKLVKSNGHASLSISANDNSDSDWYFSLSHEDRAMVDKVKTFLLSL